METPWLASFVRQQVRRLDPLALPMSCAACRSLVKPFTVEGVLWDFCPWCHHETLVPLRRPTSDVLIWKGAA